MAVRPIDGNDFMRRLTLDTSKGHYGKFMDGSEVAYTSREIAKFVEDMSTLPPPNEWVSVEGRLPYAEYGESDTVLCYTDIGVEKLLYFDGGNWCFPTGETFLHKVTHWMPLPAPPYRRPEEKT